jgi:DNA-binding MarR family transcriptional regulator
VQHGDRSDVVAAITELAEQGSVERTPDPDDRRRNMVALTTAGDRQLRRSAKRGLCGSPCVTGAGLSHVTTIRKPMIGRLVLPRLAQSGSTPVLPFRQACIASRQRSAYCL